jgi:magnesium-transporting ATPase (P-type)
VHTLFCGTHVLYTRTAGVRALVLRTGYTTSKGELIRSFLFPRRTRFRLYRDSILFVCILFFFGLVGLVYSAIVLHWRGVDRSIIAIKSLDIITLVRPRYLALSCVATH